MTLLAAIPWVLSVQTLVSMWLAGHNPRAGWRAALLGQITWGVYTFASGAWGFLPLNLGLTFVYYRNLRKATR